MSKTPPTPSCPSKGKRRFLTEEAAEASLSTIWKYGSRGGGPLPCRSYLCRCGNWHLTGRPLDYLRLAAGEVLSDHSTNPMNR